MKIAAIDVGTNSFHLIVVQISEDGSFQIIERAREMVRLGDRTLVEGVIPPESFDKAAEALRRMKQIAERHRCDEVLAYATSAVREAHNGGAFARAMRDETGISLHVIRGDEEGRLIYLGARQRLNIKGRYLIADIGGGSVEIVLADQKEIYFVASVKLGVLRLSQVAVNSDPISAEDRARLLERLHHTLDGIAAEVRGMGFSQFVLTSGTAHSLAQLASMRETNQSISVIHGAKLSFNSLYTLERELCLLPREKRAQFAGLDPKRLDTIVPGAILLKTLYELFAVDDAILCETALREGMIVDYIARNKSTLNLSEEFPDPKRRSVMQLARRCQYPEEHSRQVTRLALSLFRQTRDLHELSNQDSQLLEYAAILHDIGYHIARSQHHKHTQYLIDSCLTEFDPEEKAIISQTSRYHQKSMPKKSHPSFMQLSHKTQKKVAILASLLRIADALDRNHTALVRSVRVAISSKEATITVFSHEDPELELFSARRKSDLFEETFGRKVIFISLPAEEVQEL
jgi:exopolyphosphatase / guanosine-5'-triphosphate,3'-diphosphate pyrophosphatase